MAIVGGDLEVSAAKAVVMVGDRQALHRLAGLRNDVLPFYRNLEPPVGAVLTEQAM